MIDYVCWPRALWTCRVFCIWITHEFISSGTWESYLPLNQTIMTNRTRLETQCVSPFAVSRWVLLKRRRCCYAEVKTLSQKLFSPLADMKNGSTEAFHSDGGVCVFVCQAQMTVLSLLFPLAAPHAVSVLKMSHFVFQWLHSQISCKYTVCVWKLTEIQVTCLFSWESQFPHNADKVYS